MEDNNTRRRKVKRDKKLFELERNRSWKNKPSPKNWHEYDEWQKDHYSKFTVYNKRHVRAKISYRKWKKRIFWNEDTNRKW